ncbi:MAG TPA: glycosyltransferase family 4 protein [Phycisphaerae bacterium]|nr:glycosyltransferase family 4 protein [Phycisphaerae bacterium]
MNLLLVCHVYPPELVPAAVTMVPELAEDLVRLGHRVTVVTGWPNHPAGVLFRGWRRRFRQVTRDDRGFRVIRCWHTIHPRGNVFWRLLYYLTFGLSSMANALAAGPIDAVLCLSTPIFGSWSAWALARLKGARFVYDIFDLHPEAAHNAGLIGKGLAYAVWRTIDTLLCRKSDAIATLSEGMKDQIVERGIEPDKVAVVPFWMDAETVSPGPRDNPWRRRQQISPDTFVALYAGTIGYISGADVLIESARALSDRPDILLLCVGEGVAKDRIERLAARLGLANIRFLPFQPAEVLSHMMATADVGLVTLLPDAGKTSVPSKILGYLAAGRAVIASVDEDSETARVLREGQCGLVVPTQDGAALAAAVRQMADNPEAAQRMGRSARRCLLERFARDRCTKQYEEMLTARR